MTFELICFYAFALVGCAAALAVITVRNPVVSVLCLVLTFFSVACLWLLAQAEFLAVVLVLVYVGAVMVLFLFVVMMLNIDVVSTREGFVRFLPVGIIVAVTMLVEMLMLMGVRSMQVAPGADPAAAAGLFNIEWVGRTLFTRFLLPFEIAAVILTVGLIAAVTLASRRANNSKRQVPAEQSATKAADRVRLIKMDVVRKGGTTP